MILRDAVFSVYCDETRNKIFLKRLALELAEC